MKNYIDNNGMRLLAALVVFVFAFPAEADTIVTHIGFPICENDVLTGDYEYTSSKSIRVGDTETEGTVESDWENMTCTYEKDIGDAKVLIDVVIDEWPITLPEDDEAVCGPVTDSQNDTRYLVVHFSVLDDTEERCYELPDTWGGNGSDFQLRDDAGFLFYAPLLPRYEYEDGTYDAKKANGSTWTDISCTMRFGEDDIELLKIEIGKDAVEGSGYCPIPDDNSSDVFKVPFSLDRITP